MELNRTRKRVVIVASTAEAVAAVQALRPDRYQEPVRDAKGLAVWGDFLLECITFHEPDCLKDQLAAIPGVLVFQTDEDLWREHKDVQWEDPPAEEP